MQDKNDLKQWNDLLIILNKAQTEKDKDLLLNLLLTTDERAALLTRLNIVNELLKGNLNQRQISQLLGVGVATITRGSNELKNQTEDVKTWLKKLLEQ